MIGGKNSHNHNTHSSASESSENLLVFSDVFRGYRKATPGCNKLKKQNSQKKSRYSEACYRISKMELFMKIINS